MSAKKAIYGLGDVSSGGGAVWVCGTGASAVVGADSVGAIEVGLGRETGSAGGVGGPFIVTLGKWQAQWWR